jgi:tRNA 5-methylaminomethyl-2-thiouridine biosynthesis bifunctional protein
MRQDSFPYNPVYDDSYFTPGKGFEESSYVFIGGNNLEQRFPTFLRAGIMTIGEIGFGTGLNLWVLLDHLICWWNQIENHETFLLRYMTVEERLLDRQDMVRFLKPYEHQFQDFSLDLCMDQFSIGLFHRNPGWNYQRIQLGNICKNQNLPGFHQAYHSLELDFWLWYGQATEMLGSMERVFSPEPIRIDGWFLDGHDPKKNPEAWSSQVFQGLWKGSGPHTTFASYSAAGQVKQGLRDQGFIVKRKKKVLTISVT